MMYNQSNRPERMLTSLSTWSLSLAMLGICSGQLIAADGPAPVQAKAAITREAFEAREDYMGKPEDPIYVKINGEDYTIVFVRGVSFAVSDLTWFSADTVSISSEATEIPLFNFNMRKHDFDHKFLADFSKEERREVEEHNRSAIKNAVGELAEGKATAIESFISTVLELTINFKGGSEAELLSETARAVEDAYAQQLPSQLKGIFPDRLQLQLLENTRKPRMSPLKVTKSSLQSFNDGYLVGINAQFKVAVPRGRNGYPEKESNLLEIQIVYDSEPEFLTEYFNIGDIPRMRSINKNVGVQDVAALFELSWTMDANVVWASTKFHQETGMLIVRGTKSEIEIAKTAFNRLNGISAASNPVSNPVDQIIKRLDQLVEIQSHLVLEKNEPAKENEESEDAKQDEGK